jgi:hypothetical protein
MGSTSARCRDSKDRGMARWFLSALCTLPAKSMPARILRDSPARIQNDSHIHGDRLMERQDFFVLHPQDPELHPPLFSVSTTIPSAETG